MSLKEILDRLDAIELELTKSNSKKDNTNNLHYNIQCYNSVYGTNLNPNENWDTLKKKFTSFGMMKAVIWCEAGK